MSGRKVVVGAAASMALLVSACGSSSSSTPGSSGTTATTASGASAASALGTPDAATGPTLTVGYITDGQNGSINNLSEIPAAQAAVSYINGYLGGVGAGHDVLKLDVCNDQDTPSGATNCANQMITAKVPIVLNNTSGQDGGIYSALVAGNVPMMTYQTAVAAQLTGKLSYVLSNGVASSFAAPAALAKQLGAKQAAIFGIDVPAVTGPAKQLDPLFFKNAGLPIDVVPIAPGTADMTPQVQAEISKGTNFIEVLGDVSFCTSALKAMKTLNYSGTISIIAQCQDAGSYKGIPGGYAGVYETTVASTLPSDPDVKIYEAAMSKYANGTPPFANGVTQGGFAVVLGFARATKSLSGTPTPASIEAAITGMAPATMPFGAGGTFQCNGKQLAIAPDVCSSGALSAKLDTQGNPVGSFTNLDTSAITKL
ncbi:ABC transporter substrate-binding protein [Acidiferrimicrobium sp. IK]|uniref:ABC transporter substrate-binding protein n=1 Tax=Acidiferrimicrobium sp. IK TaxID=2871700 RepID=UPI0021CB6141|nr:ABC transporter substrate-binding protein [Acidiferrimicrobium sp. IK]MCU4186356.1 ABC transporter substrate-binding protein [Acidiferrimicrobium sp. IK]